MAGSGVSSLPPGGEIDYGKLVLDAGQAYSESIKMDPSYFVDNGMQERVDWLLHAGEPFQGNNTTVDKTKLQNVLTDTLTLSYKQLIPGYEKDLADLMRSKGVYKEAGNLVPSTVFEDLWKQSDWAGKRPGGSTTEWLDDNLLGAAHRAVVPYAALGYIAFAVNDRPSAVSNYQRAVAEDPSNYFNQKNLGSLLADQGQIDEGLVHLNAALLVVQSQPDLQQDTNKQGDLKKIQDEIQRVTALKTQKP